LKWIFLLLLPSLFEEDLLFSFLDQVLLFEKKQGIILLGAIIDSFKKISKLKPKKC